MNKLVQIAGLALICTLIAGCSPEQIKVISKTAGKAAAVGWIAKDNPTAEEIGAVKNLLDVIQEKSQNVQEGATYFETIYPELEEIINTQVDPQYRPACILGVSSLLDGIDLVFALHPEWEESEALVIAVVGSFISGAEYGLSLAPDSPTMERIRKNAKARAKVLG